MGFKKIKSVQILSNGSVNFFYIISDDLKKYSLFDKDFLNFSLNLKRLKAKVITDKNISKYKKTFFEN
jgi:hypothetical protein